MRREKPVSVRCGEQVRSRTGGCSLSLFRAWRTSVPSLAFLSSFAALVTQVIRHLLRLMLASMCRAHVNAAALTCPFCGAALLSPPCR